MPPLSKNFADARGPVQIYLSKDVKQAMLNFVQSQRLRPTISDVGELAIQEFLQREGFWPLPVQVEETTAQPEGRPKGKAKRSSSK